MTDEQTNDETNDETRDGELEPQPGNEGGNQFDDPNRQAVGLDPAWVEGTGGGGGGVEPEPPPAEPDDGTGDSTADTSGGTDELDGMTKADLLNVAKERGVSPANNDMTKQELIDGIRGAG